MNEELRSIRVSIFGREYNLKGDSDEEYIKNPAEYEEYITGLAEYVDSVMKYVADKAGGLSSDRIAILAALNIADEMHKERQRFDEFADELVQRLQEALNGERDSEGAPDADQQSEDAPDPGQQSADSE